MIPGGRSGMKAGEDCGIGCPECHEREQAEQRWRHSGDGEIGPLPPGFDAQMGTAFLEGRLDGPAMDEPAENFDWRGVDVGAKERLRITYAGWVAREHPADRAGGNPG